MTDLYRAELPFEEIHISAATALATFSVPVFIVYPQQFQYPYLVVGEVELIPDDSKGLAGYTATVTFHSWSATDGNLETNQLLSQLVRLLSQHSWSLTDFDVWNAALRDVHVFDGGFDETVGRPLRHGRLRYSLEITAKT